MLVNTKAIVFSAIKYGEADLIVSCFTEVAGLKSYLLRNILKARKTNLRSSYFQPLTQLEIIADHKNKGTLEYIKEVKVLNPYKTLHTTALKSGMVLFLAEMLKTCIREEEANPRLFLFLQTHFDWLDAHDEIANYHIYFLLQLSNYLGFYPDALNLDEKYFNIMEGVFQESSSSNYCLEGPTVEVFKHFFPIDIEEIQDIKMDRMLRQKVLDLLLIYYQFHIQGYRKPNSLAVLQQLYS